MNTRPEPEPARPQLDFIDGRWSEPTISLPGTLDDPNTGSPRQQQVATAHDDVERALAAATRVDAAPLAVRARLLELIADGISGRAAELAIEDALATGNPLRVTSQLTSYLAPRVRSALDQLHEVGESTDLPAGDRQVRLLRRPLGPAAVLAPWNAPTFVAVAKIASALAAGCPVILKPSEWAPAGCQIVSEVIAEALAVTGLPPALFQLVHGAAEVGSQLVSDRRIKAVSFTGGGAGGAAVAAATARNFTALQLELGGHNPAIVRPDADIAATAEALAAGMTKLNGQWCEAPGKILVPEHLHDDLADALLGTLGKLRIEHCLDPGTDVGPIAYSAHRDRLRTAVDRLTAQGGEARTTAPLPDLDGWFLSPTVVLGLPAHASETELFGPVVTMHAVSSVEEALAAAEGPESGLAGFVFGTDLDAALETAARLPVGEVRVNGCNLADLADGSEQSFWNNAGIGGHGPTDLVRFFQGRRTIGVDDPGLPV